MRNLLIFFAVILILSPLFAQTTNELSNEEQNLCKENIEKLIIRMQELSQYDRGLFQNRIQKEISACEKSDLCVCAVYASVLDEINKKPDSSYLSNAPSEILEEKNFEVEIINKPKAIETTDNFKGISMDILQKADKIEKTGKKLRKSGTGLLISGTIFTVYGISAIIMGIIKYENSKIFCGPFGKNSDGEEIWKCDNGKEDFEGIALISTAIPSLVIGISAMAGGIVLMKIGDSKKKEAQEMKNASETQSFSFTPIISPKSKTYGLAFSFNF